MSLNTDILKQATELCFSKTKKARRKKIGIVDEIKSIYLY